MDCWPGIATYYGEGRSSQTVGSLAINVGGGAPIIGRFSKNSSDPNGKMEVRHMEKLATSLQKLLEDGVISNTECLSILDSLSDVVTEHGSVCMISKDSVFMLNLRRICAAH